MPWSLAGQTCRMQWFGAPKPAFAHRKRTTTRLSTCLNIYSTLNRMEYTYGDQRRTTSCLWDLCLKLIAMNMTSYETADQLITPRSLLALLTQTGILVPELDVPSLESACGYLEGLLLGSHDYNLPWHKVLQRQS